MESMPASASRSTASGREALELKLMVPREVARRISRTAAQMVSACRIGSPSHPWPKETMAFSACCRWGTATWQSSSTVGTKLSRSWLEGQQSDSCREMHPRQRELQAGEVGSGASQRRKKRFLAAKQW